MIPADREEGVGILRVKVLLDAQPGQYQSLKLGAVFAALLTSEEVVFLHISKRATDTRLFLRIEREN